MTDTTKPVSTPDVPRLSLGERGELHMQLADAHAGADPVLALHGPDGTLRLLLHVGLSEVLIEPLATGVRVRSPGVVALETGSLHVRVHSDMTLHSQGPLRLSSDESVQVQAPTLDLEATRNDACITANDDVRIEGERVRMNA